MMKTKLLTALATLVEGFLVFWFWLPAINPRYPGFWGFLFLMVALVFVNYAILTYLLDKRTIHFNVKANYAKPVLIVVGVAALAVAGCALSGIPLFRANDYKDLIQKQEGNFSDDIAELKMSQIPVVDKDSAMRLGNRKMGEMIDLVSQFEVADDYTQINYQGRPIRVTPLAYSDLIKWFNNQSAGIPAYITVDMVTQEADLVRLEQGIKYSPSEYLYRNLERYLRFHYPTKIFDDAAFEIDDNGTPYWIAPVINYRIGVWGGRDIGEVVLLNACTGECTLYPVEEVPQWVDQVYNSDMIIEQLDYNGAYQSGYWNSVFGQRGVLRTTEGYNYIASNDDVYLYTGITSVTSDQSNTGFVLVNLRTKETKYYAVPGAQETSAMRSAEGKVQNLKYTSTFPILLNVGDRPTYFMSLKDAAGLVKMYAFVDVERYQVVATGSTIAEAMQQYNELLVQEDPTAVVSEEESGNVTSVQSVVIDGNTSYYFKLSGSDDVYVAAIQVSDSLPFLKEGDQVKLKYSQDDSVRRVQELLEINHTQASQPSTSGSSGTGEPVPEESASSDPEA